MFSGIVEAKSQVLHVRALDNKLDPKATGVVRLTVKKPSNFNDIKVGDSIAVNGICLTIEAFDTEVMQFALAPETLSVLGWSSQKQNLIIQKSVNLERSVQLGDRIHGHLVTGHVDGLGVISSVQSMGESTIFQIQAPEAFKSLIWRKGSVAVNGVSLTINDVQGSQFQICLIPETLKRTNLGEFQAGDVVTIEVDQFARGLLRFLETQRSGHELHS